ncbi:MAG TPA: sensor histidine kinase KdpD [Steroidobacteraceae bacterium]|nr:sensor histidine kinase KdpD [Steroidobacteraceae bacterium]
MVESRPDPDELLEHVRAVEARARRGRLRIFFGAAAGVGKTFAMLEAARAARAAGTDVVLGYVELHGRVETERLMDGLERLPTLPVRIGAATRQEFDLDGALRRRPAILVVDELAHSNLSGGDPPPRHPKRWQDIEELLVAGIDVWTTVNVQHLESLNDVVAQITGVRQRETLPDRIFQEADEVELIDLPPDDLLARLEAGKIYLAEDARSAADRFFRRGNLLALRELALRRMTGRVEAAAHAARVGDGTRGWLARDRVLVATGPDRQSEQLIRAGKRLADALDADWTVVYVETPALRRLSARERDRRVALLKLGESLGAETVTLDGPSAAEALLDYAATRRATRVVVGAPKRHGLRAWLRPSTATELARRADGFDVVVIGMGIAADDAAPAARSTPAREPAPRPIPWTRYAAAVAVCAACTALAAVMNTRFEPTNLVMIYLLGVVATGLRFGRGPSVLAAILNVAAFDFFFVPPKFTFAVGDAQYLVTFGVMLTIALTIATLMANVRQQTRVAGARERRTAMLYAMSRELAASREVAAMARIAVRHVADVFRCEAVVLLPDANGRLRAPAGAPDPGSFRGADLAVAQWVHDHGQRAGFGSDTLPAAPALYLPLGDERRRLGVLAVLPKNARRVTLPEQLHLLETFAGQVGLALERASLAAQAESARVAAEGENLRNTLLASISHDLRTPLAVMAGAASTLAAHGATLDEPTRRSLAGSIERRAQEMSELVSNVLDLTRFESGAPALRRDWESVDDLVAVALRRLESTLAAHPVELALGAELPEIFVDANLVVQVFANLFDNVAKYTPAGTTVRVGAVRDGDFLRVRVDDDGPGLPPGDPRALFGKFQRGRDEGAIAGVGLGLAICRAIVQAHGGEIQAGASDSGGARFEFTLPTAAP